MHIRPCSHRGAITYTTSVTTLNEISYLVWMYINVYEKVTSINGMTRLYSYLPPYATLVEKLPNNEGKGKRAEMQETGWEMNGQYSLFYQSNLVVNCLVSSKVVALWERFVSSDSRLLISSVTA
jgi:hypothetical protein